MRKVSLFIAMSLDGYIARCDGRVDWLEGDGTSQSVDTYGDFIQNIDTVIMGWNTYHQIVTELSPDIWVYDDLKSYVITHRDIASTRNITFTNHPPVSLIKQLKKEEGKGIWICGGAHLIKQLMKEDLIDEYYITIIPTLLGSGIALFDQRDFEIKLKLRSTKAYNGMVDLVYTKR